MTFLNTKDKRKSAVITSILMLLLLALIFIFGLDYKDPPDEYGVEINFGYTDKGSGDNSESTEKVKTTPTPQQQTPVETEPVKETPVEEVTPTPTPVEEEVMTQDTEDAPTVNNEPVKEPVEEITEPIKETEPVKEPVKETPAPAPTPDQSVLDAINGINNGPANDGTSNNGDGDSTTPGNQGAEDGNPYASSYYGGGSGNGTGYGLNGRKKLGVEKFLQDCNAGGKVVVKIWVGRNGRVIKTKIQQSDDPCLNAAAKKTAMSYKFNSDSKAPASQQGHVIIKFSLGK